MKRARTDPSGARLGPWKWALALALVLGAAGCGRKEQPAPESKLSAGDTVATLADQVERHFLLADADTTTGAPERRAAGEATRRLLTTVLDRERPSGGWSASAFESSLRDHRLAVEVDELDPGKEPWLVLVADPHRTDRPEFAWLAFAGSATTVALDPEPFQQLFQTAAWKDSLGHRLLVTGLRRSAAGPQPTAWLFALPERGQAAADSAGSSLVARAAWGLSGVGQAEVSIVRGRRNAPPMISVSRCVLPNPLFEECSSCPHVEGDVVYRLDREALVIASRSNRRSPYASFSHLIEALVDHDQASALGYVSNPAVVDQAISLGFDRRPQGGLWRIAPGSAGSSLDQIYLRGGEGAYRVLLSPGDSAFVVTSISPTAYSLD